MVTFPSWPCHWRWMLLECEFTQKWSLHQCPIWLPKNSVQHPVCYFSRKFNKHHLHYSTIEKETLALLLALQHFEVYVSSSSETVVVYTDHNPLTFLSRMFNLNQRLMWWKCICRCPVSFSTVHLAGEVLRGGMLHARACCGYVSLYLSVCTSLAVPVSFRTALSDDGRGKPADWMIIPDASHWWIEAGSPTYQALRGRQP